MALPSLINGADCGPANPLQSLSKQFDRDRSVQQDQFGPGRAGSSKEVFRSATSVPQGFNQEAAQFFGNHGSKPSFAPQHVAPHPFDLSSLQANLPRVQEHVGQITQPMNSSWTEDFLAQPLQSSSHMALAGPLNPMVAQESQMNILSHHPFSPNGFAMSSGFQTSMQHMPSYQHTSQPNTQSEFVISADQFPPEERMVMQEEIKHRPERIDADELSRTAGLLIDAVKEETNPKFKNSVFLGLMRQLRDREVVIEGTEMVKIDIPPPPTGVSWAQDFTNNPDVKGKGKQVVSENGWADAFLKAPSSASQLDLNDREEKAAIRRGLQAISEGMEANRAFHRMAVGNEMASQNQSQDISETEEDAYWRQENADYQSYWNARQKDERQFNPEWDKLQADWDNFEVTSTGIRPVTVYLFQANNPYLLGDSSTRAHSLHSHKGHFHESILEMEAAVQRDMQNPITWYQLGVKQQENEREQSAILALQRAVTLDPLYLEAWLALAISHTNEGDRLSANTAIEQWVRNNKRYDGERLLEARATGSEKSAGERNQDLVRVLMDLVRAAPGGEVDADIQTALGVLLNTSEDYEKAHDCFRAALSVRPNDWLLYNRVGATLANSGKAADALWYYYQALTLNPSYIRARFNLGISCINMKRYDEAAQHILDALVLQENDASNGSDTRGITSSALWECLRTTCMQLQRPDLAALCDSRDLEGFRKTFLGE